MQTRLAADEQVRIASEQGFAFWHASGTLYSGAGLLLQGQLERGIRQLQQGLETYRSTGAELAVPYYLSMLAGGYLQSGRLAEAGSALKEALMLVEKNDERFQEAELYRLKGELVLAESGDQTLAEECFRRAIDTARRQQSKAWELRAATSLARLWQKQGRHEEAYGFLGAIHSLFNEGLETPDLVDAAALLKNLGDGRRAPRNSPPASNMYAIAFRHPSKGWCPVDWRYLPASTLGGDTLGYHWVDEHHLAIYLVDVTGHGLDAALLSVTVANVIRAGAVLGADMKRPDQVLAKLNDAFQGEQHGQRFFTIWYGVYNCPNRELTWAGGGHPPSVTLLPGESDPLLLPSSGMMMGVLRGQNFPAQSCRMAPGTRLIVFSDGVFEIFRDGRSVWSLDDCVGLLAALGHRTGSLMDELLAHVYRLRGSSASMTISR